MRRICTLVFLLALGTAACVPGQPDPTLVAEHAALSTQIADVRNTATFAADRLAQTVEFIGTEVADAQGQRNILATTLEALGVDPDQVTPGAFVPTPPPSIIQGGDTTAPGIGGGADPLLTPASGPILYGIVTAEGVGENDCALGSVANFSISSPSIYVVATAANIEPGMTLTSRWFIAEEERIRFDFTPDFAIAQHCVWFFLTPEDTEFTPGNWSVQLELNGVPQGQAARFTISD
jgi:hypothetical protein